MSCVSLHSLFTQFLFLNLLCSCTERKLHYQIYEKNYELDYAQSTHTTCQWSTSVAIMINLYDFMIRDSLVLIITRSSITFLRSAVSIPLQKMRSCPWSATLLYMWTRCNRLFRQFNKKDYTKFKKLKSVKFISSYSTLVSRSVGMISKNTYRYTFPIQPFLYTCPPLIRPTAEIPLKNFWLRSKNFTSLIFQD